MRIIGLTGGIGSGKTTVSDEFSALGVTVVDADCVSRAVTASGGIAIDAVRLAFGNGAISPDGSMDRKFMRDLVFRDPKQRKKLESILHPIIQKECLRQLSEAKGRYCIISVPLLTENSFWKQRISRLLVVDTPKDVQITRVMKRNGFPREEVMSIINAQASRTERLKSADDIIENVFSIKELKEAVHRLHTKYSSIDRELSISPAC